MSKVDYESLYEEVAQTRAGTRPTEPRKPTAAPPPGAASTAKPPAQRGSTGKVDYNALYDETVPPAPPPAPTAAPKPGLLDQARGVVDTFTTALRNRSTPDAAGDAAQDAPTAPPPQAAAAPATPQRDPNAPRRAGTRAEVDELAHGRIKTLGTGERSVWASHEAYAPARMALEAMPSAQRDDYIARADLPPWMRSVMQGAALDLRIEEESGKRKPVRGNLLDKDLTMAGAGGALAGGVENVKGILTGATAMPAALSYGANARLAADMDAIDQGQAPQPRQGKSLAGGGVARAGDQAELYRKASPEQRQTLRDQVAGSMKKDEAFIAHAAAKVKEYQAEAAKKTGGQIPDFTDVRTVDDFAKWAVLNGAATGPTMAVTMLGALAGMPGLLAASGAMAVGDLTSNRLQFAADTTDPKRFRSADRAADAAAAQPGAIARHAGANAGTDLLLAAPYMALDVLGPEAMIAKRTLLNASGSGAGAVAKKIGAGLAGEAFGEGGQEVINVAAAMSAGERPMRWTDDDTKKIINSAAVGALMGGGTTSAGVALDFATAPLRNSAVQRELERRAADGDIQASVTLQIAKAGAIPPREVQRMSSEAFEEAAARFGVAPEAVQAALKRAAAKPVDEAPGFLTRVLQTFSSRGMTARPVPPRRADQEIEPEPFAPTMPMGGEDAPTGAAPAPSAPSSRATAAPPPRQSDALDAEDLLGAPIDERAHAAASSPTNDHPEPTDGQKDAGNYRKGHDRVTFPGLDITIENPQGSVRRGVSKTGKAWESELQHHYGYVRRTEGADGDQVDVFVRPGTPEGHQGPVFVVDQIDPDTGRFDEHKVMLGFDSREEAEAAYRSNYDRGWKGLADMTSMSFGFFKKWLADGDTKKPAARLKREAQRDPQLQPGMAVPAAVDPGAGARGGDLAGRGNQDLGRGAAGAMVGAGDAGQPDAGLRAGGGVPGEQPTAGGGVPSGAALRFDFSATFPRPQVEELNAAGRESMFAGLEGQHLDGAVRAVHDEVANTARVHLAAARALRSGIDSGTDPATGKPASPERLKALRAEWQRQIDLIDGTFEEYSSEFGRENADAFRDATLPELELARVPPEDERAPPPAPAPSAPSQRRGALDRLKAILPSENAPAAPPAQPEAEGAARVGGKRGDAAPKPRSARGRSHPKTVHGSRLLAEISRQLGGLSPSLLHDLSTKRATGKLDGKGRPATAWFNPLIGGVGKLFREGGYADTNELAEWMESEGYIEPGAPDADQRARALVQQALGTIAGGEPETLLEQQQRAERELDQERDAYYAALDEEAAAEAERERLAIMAEAGLTAVEMDALTDEDVAIDGPASRPASTADAMRALGFTEQEIDDEVAREQARQGARSQPGDGPPQVGQDAGAPPGGPAAPGALAPQPDTGAVGPAVEAVDRASADAEIAGLAMPEAMALAKILGFDTEGISPAEARTLLLAADPARVLGELSDLRGDALLAPQTEADLRARAEREAAATRADAAEQRRLADKAKADAQRDEFVLTGSNRPADVAAAAGQMDIFGSPEVSARPDNARSARDSALIEARKRVAGLRALRDCLLKGA